MLYLGINVKKVFPNTSPNLADQIQKEEQGYAHVETQKFQRMQEEDGRTSSSILFRFHPSRSCAGVCLFKLRLSLKSPTRQQV